MLGISKSNFSEWETGKRSPGIDQINAIAKALGISAGYLLGFDSSSAPHSEPSREALSFAKDFDRLDEEHKRLARGFM